MIMKKVIHITPYKVAPEAHPAIFRIIREMSNHTKAIVLTGNRKGYAEKLTPENYPSSHHNYSFEGFSVRQINDIKWSFHAERICEEIKKEFGKIDCIVSHLGRNGWRAMFIAKILDVPILTYFHGEDAQILLWNEKDKKAYSHLAFAPGARYLSVSKNLLGNIISFGFPKKQSEVLHLGVPVDNYSPLERKETDSLTVLNVGRFLNVKGHRLCLEVFSQLLKKIPEAKLLFAGSGGPLECEIQALVEKLELSHAVEFLGSLHIRELTEQYQKADVLFQSSIVVDGIAEGLPNVILEGMAMELPVLVTDVAGLPEAVVDGETGFVRNPDVSELALSLETLALDKELRERFGRAGRKRVEHYFNSKMQINKLLSYVDEACENYQLIPLNRRALLWDLVCVPFDKKEKRKSELPDRWKALD